MLVRCDWTGWGWYSRYGLLWVVMGCAWHQICRKMICQKYQNKSPSRNANYIKITFSPANGPKTFKMAEAIETLNSVHVPIKYLMEGKYVQIS